MTPRLGFLPGQLVAQVQSLDALAAVERLCGHPLLWVPAMPPPQPRPLNIVDAVMEMAKRLGVKAELLAGPGVQPQTSAPVHREPTLGFTDLCTHCGCFHSPVGKCCTCGNERAKA